VPGRSCRHAVGTPRRCGIAAALHDISAAAPSARDVVVGGVPRTIGVWVTLCVSPPAYDASFFTSPTYQQASRS
jgi:hypothetical protein